MVVVAHILFPCNRHKHASVQYAPPGFSTGVSNALQKHTRLPETSPLNSLLCLEKCHHALDTQVRILVVIWNSSFSLHNWLPIQQFVWPRLVKMVRVGFFSFPLLVTNFGPPPRLHKHRAIFMGFPDLGLISLVAHTLAEGVSLMLKSDHVTVSFNFLSMALHYL